MIRMCARAALTKHVRLALISSTAVVSGIAHAQSVPAPDGGSTSSAGRLSEIVVTATRRSTNVQNTPLSITAVGGQQLADMGISTPTKLSAVVPNVDITQGYSEGNVRIAIRGLGLSDYSAAGVSPVALYLDDVYQAYSFGVGTQLFDLDRVEVLRGPQGTLFGKNATAGAVNYFSAPAGFKNEGYLDLDLGGGQMVHSSAEGMINRELIPTTLAMRADFRYSGREDYVDNLTDGSKLGHRRSFSGRLQFDWKASDATDINLKLFGQHAWGDGVVYHGLTFANVCEGPNAVYFNCVNGAPTPPELDPNKTRSELRPSERYTTYGATLRVNQGLADFNITSISAYEKVKFQLRTNDDGNDYDFFHSIQGLNAYQVSQEIRLTTPVEKVLSGVFGLFGMYDHFRSPNTSDSTELGAPFDYAEILVVKQHTWTGAAFGNATLKLNDKLKLIGGLRYSHERKSIDLRGLTLSSGAYDISSYGVTTPGALAEKDFLSINPLNPPFEIFPGEGTFVDTPYSQITARSFNKVTYDATVDYQIAPQALLYARIAKGFRSGGFNTYAQTSGSVSEVDPETLMSYEAGFKVEMFDRRLRLNGDVYWYDYSNQQVQSTQGDTPGVRLNNAGKSRIKGFEIEAEAAPTQALHLSTSVGYSDAKYREFDTLFGNSSISLAGNVLPYAPKLTVNGGASYRFVLGEYRLTAMTNWSYRSRVYYDPFNLDVTSNPKSVTGDLRLSLDAPESSSLKWTASAYVNNVTNHKDVAFAYFVQDANISQVYGDLRTFGFEWKLRF